MAKASNKAGEQQAAAQQQSGEPAQVGGVLAKAAGRSAQLARVPVSGYEIVQAAGMNGGDMNKALKANLGGSNLSAFDFQRIKVPSGASPAWTINDPDTGESDVAKSFDGIVVAWNDQKAYWAKGLDEAGAQQGPPDCFSLNTIKGIGKPGIFCANCQFNQFGSGKGGRGKACKDWRALFVCREGDLLPVLVPVPPTSIKNIKNYFIRLAGRGVTYYNAITRFSLTKDKNGQGIEYCKIVPEFVGMIDEESNAAVEHYAMTMQGMLRQAQVQARPDDFAGDANPAAGGSDFGPGVTADGEVIDGEVVGGETGDRSEAI